MPCELVCFSVAALSVLNSVADYLGLNSFRRQLKAFLFAHCITNALEIYYDYALYKFTKTVESTQTLG